MSLLKYVLLATGVIGLATLGYELTSPRELVIPESQEGPFVVRVPQEYPTIQQAVDAVAEGGTVLIGPGEYQENVQINKSLRLVGASQELVQIQSPDHKSVTIDIEVEQPIQVHLRDFTVKNEGFLSSTGIRIKGNVQATVERVTVTGYDESGIMLWNSFSAALSTVTVSRNRAGITVSEGNAIIQDSLIQDNEIGIDAWLLLEGDLAVRRSLLSGNRVIALRLVGGLFGGPIATLEKNKVVKNFGGIYLGYDRDHNFTQILTRLNQHEPGPRVISIFENEIIGNLIYGLAVVDIQKCLKEMIIYYGR